MGGQGSRLTRAHAVGDPDTHGLSTGSRISRSHFAHILADDTSGRAPPPFRRKLRNPACPNKSGLRCTSKFATVLEYVAFRVFYIRGGLYIHL